MLKNGILIYHSLWKKQIGGDDEMNYPIVSLTATGDNIRRLRKERKVKTSELADYLGFSDVQAVYKWERGECLPTLENCFALSKYLHVQVEDILVCMDEMPSLFLFILNTYVYNMEK